MCAAKTATDDTNLYRFLSDLLCHRNPPSLWSRSVLSSRVHELGLNPTIPCACDSRPLGVSAPMERNAFPYYFEVWLGSALKPQPLFHQLSRAPARTLV